VPGMCARARGHASGRSLIRQSGPGREAERFSAVVRRRHGQRRFSTRGHLDPRSGLLLYWCSPRHPCRTCDSVCIAGCPRSVRLRSRGSRIGNAKACCSWSPPVTHAGSVDLRSAAFLEPRRHNATPVVGAPKGPCPTASDARSSGSGRVRTDVRRCDAPLGSWRSRKLLRRGARAPDASGRCLSRARSPVLRRLAGPSRRRTCGSCRGRGPRGRPASRQRCAGTSPRSRSRPSCRQGRASAQ
jgi:hypothetical protein